MSIEKITLGTRGSELALTQTNMVTAELQTAFPHLRIERQIIQTSGDKRQDLRFSEFSDVAQVDKGIFIKELEIALESSQIDAAVHSLKDVPSDLAAGFTIAAVLPRAAIEDVLVTAQPYTLETLLRPDVQIVEIRGNVPTRVKKVLGENALDAVLLAAAGLLRLGLLNANLSRIHIDTHTLYGLVLDPVTFLPAAGQGAIAIECRAGDEATIHAIRSLNHAETESRVTAEREFLKILGAGCQTPVGAHTWIKDGQLHMAVRVFNEADLSVPPVEREAQRPIHEAAQLAADLAAML
jgi:hydroxymethylbilane synthase